MKNKKLKKIKKGPLSNSEKSEIMDCLTEDVSAIANRMNRSENIIQKFVDKNTESEESVVESKTEQPARTRTSELFARNEKYGVTIMTPQASEAGDDSRHKRVKAATTHRYSDCTTTIRKNS